ncbi:unnamed protein product [Echinostoma caproni]|uniref:Ig-like domain-containing protein n=1 Tax=Echinostoma caproni TaxID=27848 RepID=A0A183AKB1_9TREM|nr:unnamed protein product [Echinostoma caproni]
MPCFWRWFDYISAQPVLEIKPTRLQFWNYYDSLHLHCKVIDPNVNKTVNSRMRFVRGLNNAMTFGNSLLSLNQKKTGIGVYCCEYELAGYWFKRFLSIYTHEFPDFLIENYYSLGVPTNRGQRMVVSLKKPTLVLGYLSCGYRAMRQRLLVVYNPTEIGHRYTNLSSCSTFTCSYASIALPRMNRFAKICIISESEQLVYDYGMLPDNIGGIHEKWSGNVSCHFRNQILRANVPNYYYTIEYIAGDNYRIIGNSFEKVGTSSTGYFHYRCTFSAYDYNLVADCKHRLLRGPYVYMSASTVIVNREIPVCSNELDARVRIKISGNSLFESPQEWIELAEDGSSEWFYCVHPANSTIKHRFRLTIIPKFIALRLDGDEAVMNRPEPRNVKCLHNYEGNQTIQTKWAILYSTTDTVSVADSTLIVQPSNSFGFVLARCHLLYEKEMLLFMNYIQIVFQRPVIVYDPPKCSLKSGNLLGYHGITINEGADVDNLFGEHISWPYSYKRHRGTYRCTIWLPESQVYVDHESIRDSGERLCSSQIFFYSPF